MLMLFLKASWCGCFVVAAGQDVVVDGPLVDGSSECESDCECGGSRN